MPAPTSPKLLQSTRRLLDSEAAQGKPGDAPETVAFRVCEKLRGPLGKLMGRGGFRSLLTRALVLASAEVPWLRTLKIEADGSLEGFHDAKGKVDSAVRAEGEVVLVAKLLGLLVTLIGPALTASLLKEIWPNLHDLNF